MVNSRCMIFDNIIFMYGARVGWLWIKIMGWNLRIFLG